MNNTAKIELLKRLSDAPHADACRSTIETVAALSTMISSAKKRPATNPHLSDAGRAAEVAKVAVDNVKAIAEATQQLRKAEKFNTTRRANLKLPAPPANDVIGEMKRVELRAFTRGLKLSERLAFASQHPEAILDAPAELCSLPPDRFEAIKQDYIKAKFGPQIAEIELIDSDLENVRAARDMALRELRENAAMGDVEFGKLVDEVVAQVDGR